MKFKGGKNMPVNQNFQIQHANPNFSSAVQRNVQSGTAVPKVDVIEGENDIVYLFELPGINPESLKVNMGNNNLNVSAQVDQSQKNYVYLHQERVKGTYNRQINVPDNTAQENISAEYNNGILEVKFSKNQPQNPQQEDKTQL